MLKNTVTFNIITNSKSLQRNKTFLQKVRVIHKLLSIKTLLLHKTKMLIYYWNKAEPIIKSQGLLCPCALRLGSNLPYISLPACITYYAYG